MNHKLDSTESAAAQPLNLNKFASGPFDEIGRAVSESEGQTMFIKNQAAQSVAQLPNPAQQQDYDFGLPLKEMLGLITYCYVRGVFSSKDIAGRIKHVPELHKAFGRRLPDEAAIKAFRRQHAAEIEELLETVYRIFPPNDPASPAQDTSQTEFVHRQAVERLHDASWEDAMRRYLH